MTFKDYAESRGWRRYEEPSLVPQDPDYEGPWDEWDGEWREITTVVIIKSVLLHDGRFYSQMMDVGPRVEEPCGDRIWELTIDIAEMALLNGMRRDGLSAA